MFFEFKTIQQSLTVHSLRRKISCGAVDFALVLILRLSHSVEEHDDHWNKKLVSSIL